MSSPSSNKSSESSISINPSGESSENVSEVKSLGKRRRLFLDNVNSMVSSPGDDSSNCSTSSQIMSLGPIVKKRSLQFPKIHDQNMLDSGSSNSSSSSSTTTTTISKNEEIVNNNNQGRPHRRNDHLDGIGATISKTSSGKIQLPHIKPKYPKYNRKPSSNMKTYVKSLKKRSKKNREKMREKIHKILSVMGDTFEAPPDIKYEERLNKMKKKVEGNMGNSTNNPSDLEDHEEEITPKMRLYAVESDDSYEPEDFDVDWFEEGEGPNGQGTLYECMPVNYISDLVGWATHYTGPNAQNSDNNNNNIKEQEENYETCINNIRHNTGTKRNHNKTVYGDGTIHEGKNNDPIQNDDGDSDDIDNHTDDYEENDLDSDNIDYDYEDDDHIAFMLKRFTQKPDKKTKTKSKTKSKTNTAKIDIASQESIDSWKKVDLPQSAPILDSKVINSGAIADPPYPFMHIPTPPPKPSFLSFIQKCASQKIKNSIQTIKLKYIKNKQEHQPREYHPFEMQTRDSSSKSSRNSSADKNYLNNDNEHPSVYDTTKKCYTSNSFKSQDKAMKVQKREYQATGLEYVEMERRIKEYKNIYHSMDYTALIAVGMAVEEILTATFLPLAKDHVRRCRLLERQRALHPEKTTISHYPNNDPFVQRTLPPVDALLALLPHCQDHEEEKVNEVENMFHDKFVKRGYLPSAIPPTFKAFSSIISNDFQSGEVGSLHNINEEIDLPENIKKIIEEGIEPADPIRRKVIEERKAERALRLWCKCHKLDPDFVKKNMDYFGLFFN